MATLIDRVDTWEMTLVHRVFRSRFRTLPSLITAVEPGDRTRAAVVAEHLTDLTGALHHHHAAEDELLWPRLLARTEVPVELIQRMRAQHHRLHLLLGTVDGLEPIWRDDANAGTRDRLADVVAEVSGALDEHLADEESEILPLVSEYLTHAEWRALNDRGLEAIPKSAKAFFFIGLILEQAGAEETIRFLKLLPAPVRLAWHLVGPRIHRRAIARLNNHSHVRR